MVKWYKILVNQYDYLTKYKDYGLFDGNYYDYENDEIAIQRESDISQEILPGKKWEDPSFPTDGRSLYFDPLCPPKGSLPADSLVWLRISDGDIEGCLSPVLYASTRQSPLIVQGALGNSYFTNALRGNAGLLNLHFLH